MLTIAEFDSLEQLAQIRLLWQDLWLKTPQRSFFQTYHWFESFCRNNPQIEKIRVLVVNLEGKPVGLFPFVIRAERKRLLKYRTLTYPLDSEGIHFGPLGAYPSTTTASVVKHLHETPRDWDEIDLQHVDVDGVDKNRIMNAMTSRGMTHRRELINLCGKVSLEMDWSDYWYRLPEEVQQRFDNAEKKLAELGKTNYARFSVHRDSNRDEDQQLEMFQALTRMEKLSFVSPMVLKKQPWGESEKKQLATLHEHAIQHGTADMHVLYLNEKPYAGIYNYSSFGRIDCQAFFLAADAICDSMDVLIAEMLRSCFAMGDREVYFPTAFYDYTVGWQNAVGTSYRHTHYASESTRAQWRRMIGWMTREKSDVEKQYRTYRETCEPAVVVEPHLDSRKFSIVG